MCKQTIRLQWDTHCKGSILRGVHRLLWELMENWE